MVTDLWRFYPVACVQPSPNLSKSHYSTIRSAQLGRGFLGRWFCVRPATKKSASPTVRGVNGEIETDPSPSDIETKLTQGFAGQASTKFRCHGQWEIEREEKREEKKKRERGEEGGRKEDQPELQPSAWLFLGSHLRLSAFNNERRRRLGGVNKT